MLKEIYFANKHMERYSMSLVTREMKTETTQDTHTASILAKFLTFINIEDWQEVEQQEFSSMTGGNTIGTATVWPYLGKVRPHLVSYSQGYP